MQPFKRFRFVHNNKELNYPAIPEPDDFFIKILLKSTEQLKMSYL